MIKRTGATGLAALGLAVVAAGCGSAVAGTTAAKPASTPAPAPTATTSSAPGSAPAPPTAQAARRARGRAITVRNSQYGRILTDAGNHTIYVFTHDTSSTSTCYGACATAWPPVLTKGTPRATGGLPSRLGTTRRRDGTTQVTYAGHPLYYYVDDTSPGDIFCQNVPEFGGTWLVVSPSGNAVR